MIDSQGAENVTTRKIAEMAGTNSALVHYYFGSKEKLINEALKIRFESLRETLFVLDDASLAPLDRLREFTVHYVKAMRNQPQVLKRALDQESLFDSQTEYVTFLKTHGLEKFGGLLKEITGEEDPERLLLMIQHIFSAVITPVIKATCISREDTKGASKPLLTSLPVEEQISHFFDHYFYKYTKEK
ncbi:TetR/AcrR family transcriptional regulator [Cohnella algarum]|nr:TetR/AcrR family transcriptional regulator [Cohnella algarum]